MANQLSPSSANNVGHRHRSVFSRFSGLSIATLPPYTVIENTSVEEPAASPPEFSPNNPQGQASPPQDSPVYVTPKPWSHPSSRNSQHYSYINPLYSSILNTISRTPFSPPSDHNGSPPIRHEFEYSYPIRSNKPWATLQLYTRDSILGNPHPAQSQPKTPRIWGSEPLSGAILLDLDNPQTIQQINLQIKGKIVTSSLEEGSYTFINHDFPVWTRSMGDPRTLSPGSPINPSKSRFDGKFQGRYSFQFSCPFPTYVDLSNKAAVYPETSILPSVVLTEEPSEVPSPPVSAPPIYSGTDKGKKKRSSWSFFLPRTSWYDSSEHPKRRRSALPQDLITGSGSSRDITEGISVLDSGATVACPMPQTFVDKGLMVTLTYELSVLFIHGRFRPDSRIRANFAYLPAVEPLPMSVRRQQAYEAGGLLPGPRSDPDGWFTLPKVTVRGLFNEILGTFGKRKIEVDCTLYLANPLSYTRGTVIPCYMSLDCTDTLALQTLSNPKAPNVRLIRQFRHFTPHGGDRTAALEENYARGYSPSSIPTQILPPTGSAGLTGMGGDLRIVVQEVAHAVWWVPPKEVIQDISQRWLEGEIHLEPGLQPSCACPIFSVEYSVEMYPPKSANLETDMSQSSSGKARAGCVPAISTQPVEITTLYRLEEPVPVAFSEAPKTKLRVLSADTIMEQAEV